MLSWVLSGAVLACGALFVLAGTAKVYRALVGVGVGVGGSAIGAALRISPRRWRRVESGAGVLEAVTGTAVCAAVCAASHPVVAGVALAAQGAVFSGLLAYARRVKAAGGCACVRTKTGNPGITWPVQARAMWVLAAGFIEALVRLRAPGSAAGWAVSGIAGVSALLLMLAAEGPFRSARCRFPIRPRPGTTAKILMNHGVFEAMAASAGPFAEGFSHRRAGCVEEFRFVAASRPGRADRAVVFRLDRAAPDRMPTVEARIEAA